MDQINAIGRRKSSVARAFVKPGSGNILVNKREYKEYFSLEFHQLALSEPLRILEVEDKYDISINVKGGGIKGQAEACRLAIARALVKEDAEVKPTLKEANKGIMTRDARKVERKKPGLRKAHISHEHIALAEARKLGIKTFAMVDTNSDPTLVDFPIPANDDAAKSIDVITGYLSGCIKEGLDERRKDREANASSGANEESEGGETRKRARTAVKKKAEPVVETPKVETPAPVVEKVAAVVEAPAPVTKAPAVDAKPDDLTKVEGIGPAISRILVAAGINTFADLAGTDAAKVKELLTNAEGNFAFHDPTTWPKQADYAAKGEWDALTKWQDELDGGKLPEDAK
ncbi:UNVERIFIED_CONTAM: hypothetical protein GTU68_007323 [Idotea baltica]|nr:hypothetical protein [Idotea baltica]